MPSGSPNLRSNLCSLNSLPWISVIISVVQNWSNCEMFGYDGNQTRAWIQTIAKVCCGVCYMTGRFGEATTNPWVKFPNNLRRGPVAQLTEHARHNHLDCDHVSTRIAQRSTKFHSWWNSTSRFKPSWCTMSIFEAVAKLPPRLTNFHYSTVPKKYTRRSNPFRVKLDLGLYSNNLNATNDTTDTITSIFYTLLQLLFDVPMEE